MIRVRQRSLLLSVGSGLMFPRVLCNPQIVLDNIMWLDYFNTSQYLAMALEHHKNEQQWIRC
jgi:hypothetical protein